MRCLVVQTAFLGDVVLTVPLLRLVRGLPDPGWLGIVTTPAGAEFLRTQSLTDEIIVFDKRGLDRGPRGLRRAARELRARRADVALIPHKSLRSAALAWWSGVPTRVGFDESAGRLLLTRVVRFKGRSHEAERLAGLIEGIGGRVPSPRVPFDLEVPCGAAGSVDRLLDERGVSPDDRLIVISPGSAWPTKRYFPERFAEAGDALAELLRATLVVTGREEDREVALAVCAAVSARTVDLSGETSMEELMILLSRARLLLANDSAAVHLAAGLGTPVVAVFGPTVPEQGFAPYTDLARVVGADVECRPCGRHGGLRCGRSDLLCMERVTSDDLIRAATELVGGRG